MWAIQSIVIPILIGIFFVGLIDLVLFVKSKVTTKQECDYMSNYKSNCTYFLKGLRDPYQINDNKKH